MKAWLFLALAAVGCTGGDACDAYAGQGCISLEVRGTEAIDQIGLDSTELGLADARSPSVPRATPLALPVTVPVLAAAGFSGAFALAVRGLRGGLSVGDARLGGTLAARQHIHLIANLAGTPGGDGGLGDAAISTDAPATAGDLAGIDLAGADLSAAPDAAPLDAAGFDAARGDAGPTIEHTGEADDLVGVFGFGAASAYTVTAGCRAFHTTGNGTWTGEAIASLGRRCNALWATGPNDLWILGIDTNNGGVEGQLFHSLGDGMWSTVQPPTSNNSDAQELMGMGGVAPDDLYIAGKGGSSFVGVYHATNAFTWNRQTLPGMPTGPFRVFAASAANVYATDFDKVYFSTGNGTWTDLGLAAGVYNDVFAFSATDVVIAGAVANNTKAQVLHKKGAGGFVADAVPATGRPLNAVFGDNGTLWAAGISGELLTSTGGAWTRVPSGASFNLNAVYAGGGAVFAVGDADTIVHLTP